MKINILKTRRGRLKTKIQNSFLDEKLTDENIESILFFVDEYEKDNLDTIEKLKRNKSIEVNKINGALRQTINAHGAITKELIGSATKRIWGSLLDDKPKRTWLIRLINWFKKKK